MTSEDLRTIVDNSTPIVRALCLEVLDDPRFHDTPGSSGSHHSYRGGLLAHTVQVVENCRAMALANPSADDEVLLVAAVYHDYNKIFEYGFDGFGAIIKKPYRALVHHVGGSNASFVKFSTAKGIPQDDPWSIQVQHCLLSHHGRPEWGSAVTPATVEALILHQADMLSAHFGEAK